MATIIAPVQIWEAEPKTSTTGVVGPGGCGGPGVRIVPIAVHLGVAVHLASQLATAPAVGEKERRSERASEGASEGASGRGCGGVGGVGVGVGVGVVEWECGSCHRVSG